MVDVKTTSKLTRAGHSVATAAAGAAALGLIMKAVDTAARKAKVPAAVMQMSLVRGALRLGLPPLLRVVVAYIPKVKDVQKLDTLLAAAQETAVNSVAVETVEALYDYFEPVVGRLVKAAEQLSLREAKG